MKLSYKDITSFPDTSKEFDASLDAKTFHIDGLDLPICEYKPFRVRLSMLGRNKLNISGSTQVTLTCSCNRCLKDVSTVVDADFDETVEIAEGLVVMDDDIGDYPFVDGEDIDVDRMVYEEILVNYPAKILCQDDCKGLCPVCGVDRNITDCGCDTTVLDPRMAQFQDVFNSFKEV